MYFRELEYISAIARNKTISKAAEELAITQPSLSRFLQLLEQELGIPLFERIDKKMELTYAGQKYMETASHIFALQHQWENLLQDIKFSKLGTLAIGITPTRGRYVLPRVLPLFRKKYPKYKLEIHEGTVEALEKELEMGGIDLLVYTVSSFDKPDFHYHLIGQEEIVACLSKHNIHIKGQTKKEGFRYPWIDIQTLADELFLMVSPMYQTGVVAKKIIRDADIYPEQLVISSVETGLSMAAQDMGVCFCTDMCAKFFKAEDQPAYCSVGEAAYSWDFVIAQRKSSELTLAMNDFIGITRSIFSGD